MKLNYCDFSNNGSKIQEIICLALVSDTLKVVYEFVNQGDVKNGF